MHLVNFKPIYERGVGMKLWIYARVMPMRFLPLGIINGALLGRPWFRGEKGRGGAGFCPGTPRPAEGTVLPLVGTPTGGDDPAVAWACPLATNWWIKLANSCWDIIPGDNKLGPAPPDQIQIGMLPEFKSSKFLLKHLHIREPYKTKKSQKHYLSSGTGEPGPVGRVDISLPGWVAHCHQGHWEDLLLDVM